MRIKHIMNPSGYRINTSAKNAVLLGLGMSMSALLLAFHPMSHARQDNQNLKMVHPVPQAKLTSSYGVENKMHKFHNGVDLAAQIDTPIKAAAAGKVVTATENLKGFKNYGTIIVIDHGNGLQTLYSHLNTLNVTEGEWVQSGQLIGGVGETGRATGPHVHFEVIKNGERVDPKNYVVIDS